MKKYTKLYLETFDLIGESYIPSEISSQPAVDIHHIDCHGMGGSGKNAENLDRIENLMAVTRKEHLKYGDKTEYMAYLYKTHKSFLRRYGIEFDEEWIDKQIAKYES